MPRNLLKAPQLLSKGTTTKDAFLRSLNLTLKMILDAVAPSRTVVSVLEAATFVLNETERVNCDIVMREHLYLYTICHSSIQV